MVGALVLDVGRLVGQPPRGGVHRLAGGLQHPGHRVLGQPVDLQVRLALPQLAGDGQVATGVAEPDGRREVQGSPGTTSGRHPRAGGGPAVHLVGELLDQVVGAHRLAPLRAVAAAVDEHQRPAGQLGESPPDRCWADLVLRAVDDEHRAPHLRAERIERGGRRAAQAQPARRRVGQHLRRDVVGPEDEVLDLLGRVRLVEHATREELHEVLEPALEPVVLVVLRPALVGVEARVEREPLALRAGDLQPARRGEGHDPAHPVGMAGRDVHRPGDAAREPHQQCPVGAGAVEDGDGVGGVLRVRVGRGTLGAAGATAPTPVEGHHAEVPRQVGHLELPEPRVDDRPGRHQQQGGPVVPLRLVHVVGDPHAVPHDLAGPVGRSGTVP